MKGLVLLYAIFMGTESYGAGHFLEGYAPRPLDACQQDAKTIREVQGAEWVGSRFRRTEGLYIEANPRCVAIGVVFPEAK